jgi:hypothetical protein
MRKSISRLILLVLSIVTLLAFAGCELTGTDSFDSLTAESRKGKTPASEPIPPPVYEGTEGVELDLEEEDYIETFYPVEEIEFTSYPEPFEFTPYAIFEFTPYDPVVFSPYATVDFTPYATVDFTPYAPELFFYYDEGEKVFVNENDPLATHKIIGYNTTGYDTTGYNTIGFDTTGFDTIGYNTIGERIIGWESSVYSLWAGQDNEAGTVYISNDNENFYITIDTNTTSDLQEVHIYVYEDESALPDKRPTPGLAPYVEQDIYADSVTVTIPITGLVNLEDYFFVIHAALVEDAAGSDDGSSLAGETAYAAGDDNPDFNGKGAWFYVVGYTLNAVIEFITEDVYEDVHVDVHEDVHVDVHVDVIEELETDNTDPEDTELPEMGEETAWAYANPTGLYGNNFLDYGFSRWGWSLGPLTSGSYEFDIYAGAGQSDITKGTLVGTLTVAYNASAGTAEIAYLLDEGFYLGVTQIYVGNEMFAQSGGAPTVAPGQLGNIHDLDFVASDSFLIEGLTGEIFITAHADVWSEDF